MDPVDDWTFYSYVNFFCETYGWHREDVLKKNTLYQLSVHFQESINSRSRKNRELATLLRVSPNIEGKDWDKFYKSL